MSERERAHLQFTEELLLSDNLLATYALSSRATLQAADCDRRALIARLIRTASLYASLQAASPALKLYVAWAYALVEAYVNGTIVQDATSRQAAPFLQLWQRTVAVGGTAPRRPRETLALSLLVGVEPRR